MFHACSSIKTERNWETGERSLRMEHAYFISKITTIQIHGDNSKLNKETMEQHKFTRFTKEENAAAEN